MENNDEKNKYVTSEDLKNQLTEHSKVIIEAVDTLMVKRVKEVRDELYIVRKELKDEISGVETNLGEKIDNVQISIDGYVKAQEDFKDEHVIIKAEAKQMKNVFKDKMGIEIQAI